VDFQRFFVKKTLQIRGQKTTSCAQISSLIPYVVKIKKQNDVEKNIVPSINFLRFCSDFCNF